MIELTGKRTCHWSSPEAPGDNLITAELLGLHVDERTHAGCYRVAGLHVVLLHEVCAWGSAETGHISLYHFEPALQAFMQGKSHFHRRTIGTLVG